MTTSATTPAGPPVQALPAPGRDTGSEQAHRAALAATLTTPDCPANPVTSPGAGRPAAATGLVLGPARREELAEVVGSYPAHWVIVGPCAGGQWFAFPRHITVQFQPSTATRAGLARLQCGKPPRPPHGRKTGRAAPSTQPPPAARPKQIGPVNDQPV
jgi:hypothetical protein